jgi:hypothetical protein
MALIAAYAAHTCEIADLAPDAVAAKPTSRTHASIVSSRIVQSSPLAIISSAIPVPNTLALNCSVLTRATGQDTE